MNVSSPATPQARSRRGIHYWKCDRPAAFHGTLDSRLDDDATRRAFEELMQRLHPGQAPSVRAAGGQGNHVTCIVTLDGEDSFARIEDGPEGDNHMAVETEVLARVRALGVLAPRIMEMDATRTSVPFAWQRMELIPCPDLNHWHKLGRLDLPAMAAEIGSAVARWQEIRPAGYGAFDPEALRDHQVLTGYHGRYSDYFHLNLDRHLGFLVERGFLSSAQCREMMEGITAHAGLLALAHGCLVHKDLALWNILGTETEIRAFIDWDDAISGDAMDDLSLLGCFYDGQVLARALEGYQSFRPLPPEHRRRFWLHLLRNMIVKAVIRVGAGYFDRSDQFYLISSGASGADLKTFTLARLAAALKGLRGDREITSL